MRILISFGLFSFWFSFISVSCSAAVHWYYHGTKMNLLFWVCFLKKIIYCSYYAMCDVILPVDYPGRSNVFMEFELKQIKSLQRCALQFFLFSSSNLKNKELFWKDKLKVPREARNKVITRNNQNNLLFQVLNLNLSPFFTLSKVGMYFDCLYKQWNNTNFSAYGYFCIRVPAENFSVTKFITLSFWHFNTNGIIK